MLSCAIQLALVDLDAEQEAVLAAGDLEGGTIRCPFVEEKTDVLFAALAGNLLSLTGVEARHRGVPGHCGHDPAQPALGEAERPFIARVHGMASEGHQFVGADAASLRASAIRVDQLHGREGRASVRLWKAVHIQGTTKEERYASVTDILHWAENPFQSCHPGLIVGFGHIIGRV